MLILAQYIYHGLLAAGMPVNCGVADFLNDLCNFLSAAGFTPAWMG